MIVWSFDGWYFYSAKSTLHTQAPERSCLTRPRVSTSAAVALRATHATGHRAHVTHSRGMMFLLDHEQQEEHCLCKKIGIRKSTLYTLYTQQKNKRVLVSLGHGSPPPPPSPPPGAIHHDHPHGVALRATHATRHSAHTIDMRKESAAADIPMPITIAIGVWYQVDGTGFKLNF